MARAAPRVAQLLAVALTAAGAVGAADKPYKATTPWTTGSDYTGYSRFARDGDGKSCAALEGQPRQPAFKLPMCKMYLQKSCCAPIHDAETQWAYETLVDVADRCLQFVNEAHYELREYFCIPCDPDNYRYTSMTNATDDDNWGEIRICNSFAKKLWGLTGKAYDNCGWMIFTNENGIIPFDDVAPSDADDPILPSKFFKSVQDVLNQIKPGYFSKFTFKVLNSTEPATNCFDGSGGAKADSAAGRAGPALALVLSLGAALLLAQGNM